MKKTLSLFLMFVTLFTLCACSKNETQNITTSQATTYSTEEPTTKPTENTQIPTEEPTTKPTNDTTCNHAYKDATCTEAKTCTVCGKTSGNAKGHVWGNPTCVTPRSCIICFEVDSNSEPIGHSFTQGFCEICGENDPDYIPTITANKTNLKLTEETDVVYITISGDYTIEYDVDNTSVVDCEWGDWDGYTIPLTFYPISSGETYVTVSIEGYDVSVVIEVSVKMQYSTLTIIGVDEEYTTYYTGLSEAWCFLHSAEYKQNDHPNDDSVYFEIEVIAELLGDNCYNNDDYGISYELFRDDVCVETSTVWFDARYYNRKSADTFNFFGKAGNYTLKFKDLYI